MVLLNVKSALTLAFVDAHRGGLEAWVYGGTAAIRFITGQRLHIERDECGYQQEIVTESGRSPPAEDGYHPVMATAVTVSIPIEIDGIVPGCRDFPSPGEPNGYEPGTSCRVEAPQFVGGDPGWQCAADSSSPGVVTYIDEFFRTLDERIQEADFSTLPMNTSNTTVAFTYSAPLCLKDVRIGPKDVATKPLAPLWPPDETRLVFDPLQAARTEWTMDRIEDLFVEPPPVVDDGDDDAETIFGRLCTTQDEAIFVEGDEVQVKFELVEVYPLDIDAGLDCWWPWDYSDDDDALCPLEYYPILGTIDKAETVPNPTYPITVSVLDGISGKDLETDAYTYADDDEDGFGLIIDVTVGNPNPFAPFTLPFLVIFTRAIDGSQIIFDRSAIVLGVIPEDVPQIFTMTTDDTLVYAVIRDPPGGASTAALRKGNTITTSMMIDGMHAGDISESIHFQFDQSQKGSITAAAEPFGFGVSNRVFEVKDGSGNGERQNRPTVKASRGSSQHFDLHFTFHLDVETSRDPGLAGQASDIILGGGMNLRVLRAIQIRLEKEPTSEYCILGQTTSEFLPSHVSTFVFSVYEIEQMMERLGAQLKLLDQDAEIDGDENDDRSRNRDETLSGLANWQKVLATYRAATVDSTQPTVAGAIDTLISDVIGMSRKFHRDMADAGVFIPELEHGINVLEERHIRNMGNLGDQAQAFGRGQTLDKISTVLNVIGKAYIQRGGMYGTAKATYASLRSAIPRGSGGSGFALRASAAQFQARGATLLSRLAAVNPRAAWQVIGCV